MKAHHVAPPVPSLFCPRAAFEATQRERERLAGGDLQVPVGDVREYALEIVQLSLEAAWLDDHLAALPFGADVRQRAQTAALAVIHAHARLVARAAAPSALPGATQLRLAREYLVDRVDELGPRDTLDEAERRCMADNPPYARIATDIMSLCTVLRRAAARSPQDYAATTRSLENAHGFAVLVELKPQRRAPMVILRAAKLDLGLACTWMARTAADLGRVTMQALHSIPETRDVALGAWPKRFERGTLGAYAAIEVGSMPRGRSDRN